jgi:hypothetical protein
MGLQESAEMELGFFMDSNNNKCFLSCNGYVKLFFSGCHSASGRLTTEHGRL